MGSVERYTYLKSIEQGRPRLRPHAEQEWAERLRHEESVGSRHARESYVAAHGSVLGRRAEHITEIRDRNVQCLPRGCVNGCAEIGGQGVAASDLRGSRGSPGLGMATPLNVIVFP